MTYYLEDSDSLFWRIVDEEALLPRHASGLLHEALDVFRVVVVNGPRQSGKSTLLDLSAAARGSTVATLDDPRLLRSARTDPTGFLEGLTRPGYIDEVQRGGDPLILAIKAAADRNPRQRGQVVLSGSSKFLGVPTLSETLAGRAGIIDLWPLSQGEHDGKLDQLIDHLFKPTSVLRSVSPEAQSRGALMNRVVRGGFPEVRALDGNARRLWFDSYIRTVIERELMPLYRARQVADLPRLLAVLAARTAQELNVSSLARTLEVTKDICAAYVMLLSTVYLHFELPGWSDSVLAEARKRPKLHMVDSGLAAHLRRESIDLLSNPIRSDSGPIVESFVAGELVRQVTWSEERPRLAHYRDAQGREVDFILETSDGRIVAVEVKTAIDVDETDFRWLGYLRNRLGDRFVNGVVLHIGDRPLPFGDRLTALPISALWS